MISNNTCKKCISGTSIKKHHKDQKRKMINLSRAKASNKISRKLFPNMTDDKKKKKKKDKNNEIIMKKLKTYYKSHKNYLIAYHEFQIASLKNLDEKDMSYIY